MADNQTLARPYAAAAYEHAVEQVAVPVWGARLADLAALCAHADIKALIAHPKFDKRRLEALMLELLGADLGHDFANFVRILVHNGRIGLAAAVRVGFEQLRARAEATAQVHVVSAYALSADAEKAVAEAVKARFKRAVTVTATVDASLIAGAVIRVGDAVIDISARGRLNRLALDLAS